MHTFMDDRSIFDYKLDNDTNKYNFIELYVGASSHKIFQIPNMYCKRISFDYSCTQVIVIKMYGKYIFIIRHSHLHHILKIITENNKNVDNITINKNKLEKFEYNDLYIAHDITKVNKWKIFGNSQNNKRVNIYPSLAPSYISFEAFDITCSCHLCKKSALVLFYISSITHQYEHIIIFYDFYDVVCIRNMYFSEELYDNVEIYRQTLNFDRAFKSLFVPLIKPCIMNR